MNPLNKTSISSILVKKLWKTRMLMQYVSWKQHKTTISWVGGMGHDTITQTLRNVNKNWIMMQHQATSRHIVTENGPSFRISDVLRTLLSKLSGNKWSIPPIRTTLSMNSIVFSEIMAVTPELELNVIVTNRKTRNPLEVSYKRHCRLRPVQTQPFNILLSKYS